MKKELLRRFLLAGLLLGAVLALYQYSQVEKPALVNMEGQTFTPAVVTEVLRDNQQENGSRIGDQLVRVELTAGRQRGQQVEANCPNGMLFGAVCVPGQQIILLSSNMGPMGVHTVYSLDRTLAIAAFVGGFLALLCLVGGAKGLRSAMALLFTFTSFLLLFFPMLLHGHSPIFAAVVTSLLILAATVYLINGWSLKALAAGTAAFGGVLAAGLTAVGFGWLAGLSGYNLSNIESLMFIQQNTGIDVGQLLFAGILFASLGAVLDIAMDVAAAADELRRHNPALGARRLFASGMHIGRDVMGTMATTLILAFFGGSLGIWVLDYVYALPYLQLVNSNAVGIEVMQGLSGSVGVILTVPLAAALSAWLPEGAARVMNWSVTNRNRVQMYLCRKLNTKNLAK